MITAAQNYFRFLWRCARVAFVGDWRYYTWMSVLTAIVLLGLNAYCKQLVHGLVVTGMSDEVMKSALLPFYTSKPAGSGLGLPLCREIVEAHGGHLRLERREGGGIEVVCWLPQG